MATVFFIDIRPHLNGRFFIHKKECPLLPSHGKRRFLGTFLSRDEAAEEGKKYFDNPDYCPFCLHGEHSETEGARLAGTGEKPAFITHVGIKTTWESAIFCSVN